MTIDDFKALVVTTIVNKTAKGSIKRSDIQTLFNALADMTGTGGGVDMDAVNAAITTAINDLVAAAPGALNTLKELADALGDDANFASTVNTAIAANASAITTKVDKTTTVNGHALSGNVSVTKADVGLGAVPNADATNPANISQDASHRFVTDAEKATWNAGTGGSIANTDALAEGTTNLYFTTKRSLDNTLIVSRLEFIQGSTPSATYNDSKLVGKQLTYLSIEGVPIGMLPRSSTYMTFNSTTGTVTLTNSMFQPDDYVLILYRGAPLYLRDGGGALILDGSGNPQIIN